MRNLSSSHVVDPCIGVPSLSLPDLPRSNTMAATGFCIPDKALPPTKSQPFSQVTRKSAMSDNINAAMGFMDMQHRVLKDLIKQFQIFSGYREQLIVPDDHSRNPHAWSVYLMHVQAVQEAFKSNYRGKILFGNGAEPPVRFHLDNDGRVEPFDLPDPSLSSMVSIRSFIAGVGDHNLPSVELSCACIAELLNALVDVQNGRQKLYQRSKGLQKRNSIKTISITTDESKPTMTEQRMNWFNRFLLNLPLSLSSFLRASAHS